MTLRAFGFDYDYSLHQPNPAFERATAFLSVRDASQQLGITAPEDLTRDDPALVDQFVTAAQPHAQRLIDGDRDGNQILKRTFGPDRLRDLTALGRSLYALFAPKWQPLQLGEMDLTLDELHEVAVEGRPVRLAPEARERIERNRHELEALISGSDRPLYGVTTGFGIMASVRIQPKDVSQLQLNLIRSHASGTGSPLSDPYVRSIMLLRANSLTQGASGVRAEVVELLLECLNHGIHPFVPDQGSVGASGDLVPLSHIALALIGEGQARVDGRWMSAAHALQEAGLKPLKLESKEGLALINGTQFITGLGGLSFVHMEHLADLAEAAAAMSLEAVRGTLAAFDARVHKARRHSEQEEVARRMLEFITEGETPSEIRQSLAAGGRVQDPYSLRAVPQIHGAVRHYLHDARALLTREINAATDNPLVFPGAVISGGNFHGQFPAMALDTLAMGASTLLNVTQARLANLLTNTGLTGLPAFLAADTASAGLQSGLMMLDVGIAALAAEGRLMAMPASVGSISTAGGQEDHVSMGASAARKAVNATRLLQQGLAIEMLSNAQALDLVRDPASGRRLRSSHRIEGIRRVIRAGSPFISKDRSLTPDLAYTGALLATHAFTPFLSRT